MFKAVIFDFDGTICDTGKGIRRSARYALESLGFPCPPAEELDYFIGPPLFDSFKQRHGATDEQAHALVEKYREDYRAGGLFESELYDGIAAMLQMLRVNGIRTGIASSKPELFVRQLLEYFKITDLFDTVVGVAFGSDRETKKSLIARAAGALGCAAEETLMVGDRFYDIDGAKQNGFAAAGVLWGFGSREEFEKSGADFILERPGDVEAVALGMYEKTLAVNTVLNGRILHMHVDDVELCNGMRSKRECVDHPGGVAVIGLTEDGLVPLVRQFRYPYRETIYEIPAGKVEKGEDPFNTGVREFKEECGAVADNYFSLGEIYPSPGYTDEIIRLFGATGIRFEEQEPDEGEFLEIHMLPLDKLTEMIMSGEVKDAKTVTAVFKLKEYLKNHDLS